MDAGLSAVEDLIAAMSIDAQWSIREERGITWWPYLTRQHLWAAPLITVDDQPSSHVRAVAPIARDVGASPKLFEALAAINMGASLGAVVFEPDQGTVFLNCGVIVVEGNWSAIGMLMKTAVALQISQAESASSGLIPLIGGDADNHPHPTSGVRLEPDDMLDAAAMYRQVADAGTTFGDEDLVEAARILAMMGLSTVRAQRGSVTLGLHENDIDASVHCLNTPHPSLGAGTLILMETPWNLSNDRAAAVANDLNRLDASEWAGERRAHQLGAWTHNRGIIHYVCFLPGLLVAGANRQSRSAHIINAVFSMIARLRVAGPIVAGVAHDSGRDA